MQCPVVPLGQYSSRKGGQLLPHFRLALVGQLSGGTPRGIDAWGNDCQDGRGHPCVERPHKRVERLWDGRISGESSDTVRHVYEPLFYALRHRKGWLTDVGRPKQGLANIDSGRVEVQTQRVADMWLDKRSHG